jgi:hypothetical protein
MEANEDVEFETAAHEMSHADIHISLYDGLEKNCKAKERPSKTRDGQIEERTHKHFVNE